MTDSSPTVRRRRLGNRLRRARLALGLTGERVADLLEISQSKVSRIESGAVPVRPKELREILDLYQAAGAERAELLELGKDSGGAGWWRRYKAVMQPGYYSYIGFEAEASEIVTWEPTLVPGFLQTEGYYRAIMAGAGGAVLPEARVEALLEVRLERQRHLAQTRPALEVITDESVLHRVVGNRKVMAEQYQRLIEAAGEMTIRVMPYERGADIAGIGGFTILRYSDGLEVVWGETVAGDSALEEDRPDRCLAAVEHLRSAALDRGESLEMLEQALERSA